MRLSPTVFVAALACTTPAVAASPPPEGAKPLSNILAHIEHRPDFGYVDEAEFEHGSYRIEFYTKDGVKHKITIDPATGREL